MARLLEERERWLLWLPVALGTGVALYFALPVEPPLWPGAAGVLPVAAVALWLAAARAGRTTRGLGAAASSAS